MCFKVNHYTYLNMLSKSLQMHHEGRVLTRGNTLQGEPGPFQKQVTQSIWNQGSLLALKEFQDLCLNLIATIATDNTIVDAYLRRGGPLCALLWRILTWCSRKQAQARHIHSSTMSRPGIHCVETQCLVVFIA